MRLFRPNTRPGRAPDHPTLPARLRLCLAVLAVLVCGHVAGAGVVTVSQPWLPPAARHASTPLYLVLGTSEPATLVGARSPLGEVQLYDGKRRVEAWPLVPGATLVMTVNGPHLVVRDIDHALARSERVPITLRLRDADGDVHEIEVDAEVRLRSPIDDERRAHGMHPH
ncbi:MAG TPA: copper chaperone PCu(A)C [Casimicrobiaceae bacterium]|nr:copper chaperone PCu(A)C [Casimicrobiaceae bacterium]